MFMGVVLLTDTAKENNGLKEFRIGHENDSIGFKLTGIPVIILECPLTKNR